LKGIVPDEPQTETQRKKKAKAGPGAQLAEEIQAAEAADEMAAMMGFGVLPLSFRLRLVRHDAFQSIDSRLFSLPLLVFPLLSTEVFLLRLATQVARSTLEQVRAHIAFLRANTTEKVTSKNFDFDARLNAIKTQEENLRREKPALSDRVGRGLERMRLM
jgi:hypothetical protein